MKDKAFLYMLTIFVAFRVLEKLVSVGIRSSRQASFYVFVSSNNPKMALI